MQKFVKDYMSTLKDVEGVLKKKIRIDSHFENSVLDLRVKAPFFNYMIGQRNHKCPIGPRLREPPICCDNRGPWLLC